jgi:capsular exopolysaccharide synthesis family protein
MSKHFELMQQIEQESRAGTAFHTPAHVSSDGRDSEVLRNTVWAREEALRLAQQIFFLQSQQPPKAVVFAGIDHGSGCSHICSSVARTLATISRKPVCLVEANFRSPALPEMYGTTHHHGLTEALLHGGLIGSYLKPIARENLWLLSSGTLAADSANLLTTERFQLRLAELRSEFEFVIVDAPPLNLYSDAIGVGQHADGLVLVIEADATRRKSAQAAVDALHTANIPILAAVLNKRSFPIPHGIYKRI